ncbi:hypothetical protein ABFX02_05G010700 [Erythranthe guttata]
MIMGFNFFNFLLMRIRCLLFCSRKRSEKKGRRILGCFSFPFRHTEESAFEHARRKRNLQVTETMKKVNSSNNGDANNGQLPKQKERHIVSWSKEEDDILREQIRVHGTENWAIIASKFKDKTTRQCRRRWFTYLNSDFKKGGWSPEEDMLLCEAQKVFGNRWTEIAKVVSGRTDNAVKNRFTTLCKKRAKKEALAKENTTASFINLNNKRVIFRNNALTSENAPTLKKTRTTFLGKDDPKMLALIQQEELLSSLAIKVNTEQTEQSLENAWIVLQDFLKENEEVDLLPIKNSDIDFNVEKFKELVEDLRSCDEGSRSSWRESSSASSEYSTGSTLLSNAPCDITEECELQSGQYFLAEENEANIVLTCGGDMGGDREDMFEYSSTEFCSPVHVTPLFRSLAASIPSPKFSESEKHFLMKTLGMDCPSQNPPCKRSLLHCL